MTVLYPSSYTKPAADPPMTHARIAHSRNWLSGGTVAASTTAPGFFADAPTNSLTYEEWKPSALAATWTYTHTSSAQVDYCCIAAHTLGTTGCSISIEYYDGSTWQTLIASTVIASNSPIFAIFEPVTATQFRLSISGPSTLPKIAAIKFGEALKMQRPIYGGHAPITLARKTILRSNLSETGEYLGQTIQRTYGQTSFAWANLTAAWIRAWWPDLQRAVEREPFWIAWRPEIAPGDAPTGVVDDGTWDDATFWDDATIWLDDPETSTAITVAKYGEVGYCQVSSVPIPVNQGVRDLMSVSMEVRARGYD